jgi:hypothetical protein
MMRVVPIYLDKAGKACALNRGIDAARGDLLIFTDDDVVFSPTWITHLWRASKRHNKAAGLCGPILPIYPYRAPQWIKEHPFRVPAFAEFVPPLSAPQPCPFVPFGPNFAIRARLDRRLLFRTDLGASEENGPISCEDTDFAVRFRQHVGSIWFVPEASVGHRIRDEQLTSAWLLERSFLLGRSVIAQSLPRQSCHAPVWRIPWHPSLWTLFDRSLVINYLLGQMYQAIQRDADDVTTHVGVILAELAADNRKYMLSRSAQHFVDTGISSTLKTVIDKAADDPHITTG